MFLTIDDFFYLEIKFNIFRHFLLHWWNYIEWTIDNAFFTVRCIRTSEEIYLCKNLYCVFHSIAYAIYTVQKY